MTDPTNHPQGAEVILQQRYASVDETFEASAIAAMHTHTEDWLKHFVERVKEKMAESYYDCDLPDEELDSLLSEVTAKMKEGK